MTARESGASVSLRQRLQQPIGSPLELLRSGAWWVQALLVLVVVLIKYGAGVPGNLGYLVALAQHWQHPLGVAELANTGGMYLLSSSTSAVVAGVLHFVTYRTFLLFHLGLVCVAITLPFFLLRYRSNARSLMVVLYLASGIAPTLLTWVGSYDPATVIGATMGSLATSRRTQAFGWALFAFNNLAQAGLGFVAFGVVVVARDRTARDRIITGAVGCTLGFVALVGELQIWHGSILGRSAYFSQTSALTYIQPIENYFPLIVFSALGIGWAIVLHPRIRSERAVTALVVVAVVMSFVVARTALDESRVLTIVMLPASAWLISAIADSQVPRRISRVAADLIPAALFVPVILVWSGNLLYSGWLSTQQLYLLLR